jgi:hypothetical protein
VLNKDVAVSRCQAVADERKWKRRERGGKRKERGFT